MSASDQTAAFVGHVQMLLLRSTLHSAVAFSRPDRQNRLDDETLSITSSLRSSKNAVVRLVNLVATFVWVTFVSGHYALSFRSPLCCVSLL